MTDWYKIKRILVWQNNEEKQIYPASRLPSAYQEVEYIQSSWSWGWNWQFINTWVSLTGNCEVKFKYSPTAIQTPVYEYSTMWASNWGSNILKFHGQMNPFNVEFGSGSYNSPVTITQDWIYTVDFTANNWTGTVDINWTMWTFSYTWWWASRTIVLFASQEWDSWTYQYWFRSSLKLYYCELYNSWTLVREFIPCYRKSDSVIWLYDIVNDTFYTNQWSWTFTKWQDVN